MYRTGLLVLTAPLPHLQSKISSILCGASKYVQEYLYVHLVPDFQHQGAALPRHVQCNSKIKQLVTGLYSQSVTCNPGIDVRVLLGNIHDGKQTDFTLNNLKQKCDVILTDCSTENAKSLTKFIAELFPSLPKDTSVQHLNIHTKEELEMQNTASSLSDIKLYDNVVLGGTFDRLHTGHKILLTEACVLCQKSLTIGVTDGDMNNRKTLCELMEPISDRIMHLRNFLEDVKPSINYNIVPIIDPFGPSIVDPELQCIVVSQETTKGGAAVNVKRKDRGLNELDVDVIELVEDVNHSPEEEVKISSSSTRMRLLGTLLKEPQGKCIAKTQFVIGLTGGIASGKTSVCKRLEGLGAAIVDCDKLGHKAYVKGTVTLQKIVDCFGEDILDENGEVNRRALGAKVFAERSALDKLNEIVWPAIAELAKEQIKNFSAEGKRVVILDAAVLLDAGWQEMCHEVWVSVIPKPEAVKRIMERNKLSEEQALQRINSQITNQQRVDQANVVLSTLWEPEVTQKQVEKAWELLQNRLER